MAVTGLRVVPTKGYLLELKRRIEIIKEGYRLLSMKRDELTAKLTNFLEQLKAVRRGVLERVEQVLIRFREAYALLGPDVIKAHASLNRGVFEVDILPLSIMGILVPRVKVLREAEVEDKYGYIIREQIYELRELLQDLIKIAELEMKIEIISSDLERTNRIVNALEKIIIPEMEQLARYIAELIEEESLEEFTRIKLIRDLIVTRRGE